MLVEAQAAYKAAPKVKSQQKGNHDINALREQVEYWQAKADAETDRAKVRGLNPWRLTIISFGSFLSPILLQFLARRMDLNSTGLWTTFGPISSVNRIGICLA